MAISTIENFRYTAKPPAFTPKSLCRQAVKYDLYLMESEEMCFINKEMLKNNRKKRLWSNISRGFM